VRRAAAGGEVEGWEGAAQMNHAILIQSVANGVARHEAHDMVECNMLRSAAFRRNAVVTTPRRYSASSWPSRMVGECLRVCRTV